MIYVPYETRGERCPFGVGVYVSLKLGHDRARYNLIHSCLYKYRNDSLYNFTIYTVVPEKEQQKSNLLLSLGQ